VSRGEKKKKKARCHKRKKELGLALSLPQRKGEPNERAAEKRRRKRRSPAINASKKEKKEGPFSDRIKPGRGQLLGEAQQLKGGENGRKKRLCSLIRDGKGKKRGGKEKP